MPNESTNYERNKDCRNRRRFRERERPYGRAASEAQLNRYKSLNDINDETQGVSVVAKIAKWFRKSPPLKESGNNMPTNEVDNTQFSGLNNVNNNDTNTKFNLNLGLGNYIGKIADNGLGSFKKKQTISSSLVNISMTSLLIGEETESTNSATTFKEIQIETLSPYIQPQIPLPNILQSTKGILQSANSIDDSKWSLPAYTLIRDLQFVPGDKFYAQPLINFTEHIASVLKWKSSFQQGCEQYIKHFPKRLKGKRSKKQIETKLQLMIKELKQLDDSLQTFLQNKSTCDDNAIMLTSCDNSFVSLASLHPTKIGNFENIFNNYEQDSIFRRLILESIVNVKIKTGHSHFVPTSNTVIYLFTDFLLIAKQTDNEDYSDNVERNSALPNPHDSTLVVLGFTPLTFVGIQEASVNLLTSPPTSSQTSISGLPHSDSAIGESMTSSQIPFCSSSSGISTTSNEDTGDVQSEDGFCSEIKNSTLPCKPESFCLLNLYWAPNVHCEVQFSNNQELNTWRRRISILTDNLQDSYSNKVLNIKVRNECAPEKCVHKYLSIGMKCSVPDLKDRALKSWNMSNLPLETGVAIFLDGQNAKFEYTLLDEDWPFLLVLYLIELENKSTIKQMEDVSFQSHLTPKHFDLPIRLDNIFFSIHEIQNRNLVEVRQSFRMRKKVPIPTSRSIWAQSTLNDGSLVEKKRQIFQGNRSRSQCNLNEISQDEKSHQPRNRARTKSRFRSRSREVLRKSKFGQAPIKIWPDCHVSMSIVSLFVIVFYKGGLIEGIFRKSALKHDLDMMIMRVDLSDDQLSEEECSPILAASVLKKFFADIPGHLLIDANWSDWCKLLEMKTDEQISSLVEKLLKQMPKVNQSLLAFLLFTLAQINANESANRMSIEALSSVWGPNLLSRPNSKPTVEDSKTVVKIVTILIDQVTTMLFIRNTEFLQEISLVFMEMWQRINVGVNEILVPEGISILNTQGNKKEQIISKAVYEKSPCIERIRSLEKSIDKDQTHFTTSVKIVKLANSLRLSKSFSISKVDTTSPPPLPPRIKLARQKQTVSEDSPKKHNLLIHRPVISDYRKSSINSQMSRVKCSSFSSSSSSSSSTSPRSSNLRKTNMHRSNSDIEITLKKEYLPMHKAKPKEAFTTKQFVISNQCLNTSSYNAGWISESITNGSSSHKLDNFETTKHVLVSSNMSIKKAQDTDSNKPVTNPIIKRKLTHCMSDIKSDEQRVHSISGCRRFESLYEQNKRTEYSSRTFERSDQMKVDLSRVSSHTSTGSSCSTLINPRNKQTEQNSQNSSIEDFSI